MSGPRVCIVGTGYVGMASAVGLAELGHKVVGYDIARDRVAALRAGVTPYREAGIEELLRKHLDTGLLRFETDLQTALDDSPMIMLAVGTPASEDGSADLRYVDLAVEAIADARLEPGAVLAVRSTVPVGTSDRIAQRLAGIAQTIFAPEFLREGTAVSDFLHPDRVIVGTESTSAAIAYARYFEPARASLLITTRRNAELIKISSNAFLALKISFANEIANLCDACGGDSDEVLRGVGYDRRIGGAFLAPGIGFGGPCFEKDVKSLASLSHGFGVRSELASATLRVNESQPHRIVELAREELGTLEGASIGVWGLAFKAGTDDTRDSLAVRVVAALSEAGATVRAYDPEVTLIDLPSNASLVQSAEAALDADALVVLTEWPEFRAVHPRTMAAGLRRKVVIDGRNVLDRERVALAGLRYRGIGQSELPADFQMNSGLV
jgi:UDPglucose 6-dehydrogenase